MSRIGKKTIILPHNIKANIDRQNINIIGPKGQLSYQISNYIKIEKQEEKIKLYISTKNQESRALYGLSRTIINNMVIGVSKGFNKKLEIHGVGYRAQMNGKDLILNVGYSHPVIITPPENISIQVQNNTQIIVDGINKEIVGQIAAKIRNIRPPEPYKGKGIRYLGEKIRRKAGKAGK